MRGVTFFWFVAVTVAASWLGMMFVHEFGHVLHAWLSGGQIERVVLHPLRFSRTDVSPNPRPLFVAWGGPIWGVVLPLLMWSAAVAARRQWTYLLRFFAGMCLIVNGAYIGAGWSVDAGDAGTMRALGTSVWAMVVFGMMCLAAGLWTWHGVGERFRRGTGREAVGVTLAAIGFAVVGVLISTTR